MGDQLALDIYGIDANEEDSSINIVSDGEIDFPVTLPNERLNNTSPSKKRLDVNRDSAKESKQGGKLFNIPIQRFWGFYIIQFHLIVSSFKFPKIMSHDGA